MRLSNEIKAGLVVVAAIAIGVMFFGKTADFSSQTYELKTYFGYAGDLKPDAVVKLAGIEVGRVREIHFVYDRGTRVECILDIDIAAKVRADAMAFIGTAGFVGDAYVGMTAGESDEFISPGDTVSSEDPIQMREIMKKADSIANNLDGILVKVRSLVTDNKDGIDNIVGNLEATTENFKEFSEDVKKHPWKLMFKGE